MENTNEMKALKYLVSVEKLAQEILVDRKKIIMLDRQRNGNREALRDLVNSGQRKCYITIGSVLVKNNVEEAVSLLEADQKLINIDINKIRSNLKVKVNNLRDLGMLPPIPGLLLEPLSQSEKTIFSLI